MKNKKKYVSEYQQLGLGLPEIMVGLAIGLIVTIVIVQVMGVFEGQKRTTGGSADAQTNGGIAMGLIQRRLQAAGFGLPIYSTQNTALKCDPSPTIDQDGDASTPPIGIFPVSIIDGGATGGSDTIIVRSGTTSMGGAPIRISNVVGSVVSVTNNLGCADGDIALVSQVPSCTLRKVTLVNKIDTTQITMDSATGLVTGATMACMGAWNEITYAVNSGNLVENTSPAVVGIVNIQAQYGISATASDNQVNHWVDATGATWATPTVADRNRIKAVRIAVVARNDLKEAKQVTSACTAPASNGPCAWPDTPADPAPKIDLSADPNWQNYRYRVFTTIIPLRNIIWSRTLL
ncbi:PilW family protein [Undibacterium sp. TJN25]|uniref:PilW family protein n=1 Tax=Undibacterium sp. TJN25 TaxID=3413056 RepID=UPI003BF14EA5